MNPDDVLNDVMQGSLTLSDGNYSVVTNSGLAPIGISSWSAHNAMTAATPLPKITRTVDEIMDEHSLNRIAVDHKVTAQELLKLQEVAPDYASEIKENIAKNLARDIAKKVMFKKKHDKDADVHHFIGRVWVFTDEELKELLNNVH
jgi:hypothetical protein